MPVKKDPQNQDLGGNPAAPDSPEAAGKNPPAEAETSTRHFLAAVDVTRTKTGRRTRDVLQAKKGAGKPDDDEDVTASRPDAGLPSAPPPKLKRGPKKPTLSPELLPVKAEMEQWVQKHMSTISFFLEDRGAPFKIIYGDWFYYAPKKNEICLGVKAFKEAKEAMAQELAEGSFTIDQIFFAFLHEIAHLKTTRELDRAGKVNLLNHFRYMARKKIESRDQPGKYISLAGTYGHYYNILEDAIVNCMVLNTIHFSDKKKQEEIIKLYTSQFFQLFKKVGPGRGDHVLVKDAKGKEEFKKVKTGEGEYLLLQKEDYARGFDLAELEHMDKLTSQFLSLFIKSQMGVLDAKDIYDGQKYPEGKFKVAPAVADVYKMPLGDLYEKLLQSILDKYKDNPEKLKKYLQFMGTAITVPFYQEDKGKVVKTRDDVFFNVFSPDKINSRNLVNQAYSGFLMELEKTGIKKVENMTFVELLEEFKKVKPFASKGFTMPFKYTYAERTVIIRRALEPIFTMLCVLDDSFDLDLPQSTEPGEEGEEGDAGGENEENENEPENPPEPPEEEDLDAPWREGVEVINNDRNSPNFKKHGQISKVYYNENSNVIGVDIEYFEEENSKINTVINEREVNFTGDEEYVENPVKNLTIVKKKLQKPKPGQANPQKIKYTTLDKEKQKQNPENPEKPEPGEGGEPKEPAEPKEGEEPEEKPQDPNDPKGMDELRKIFGDLIDSLEEEIDKDQEDANAQTLNKVKQEPEFREKKARKKYSGKLEKLLQEYREKHRKKKRRTGQKNSKQAQKDHEVIKLYQYLEEKIRPYVNKMAKIWVEYIKNIVQEIHAEKDKYYTEGKLDIKKVQRHFPEIVLGASIDDKLLKTKWIEKIRTELRPKMLRIHLVVDNSGSMGGYVEKMQMAIMLINSSLRSLRALFAQEMKNLLGSDYTPDLDLVCDVKISLFGNQHKPRTIKDYSIDDFSFLNPDPHHINPLPQIGADDEVVATLLAFRQITAKENTFDGDFWARLLVEYEKQPALLEAIRRGYLTDMVLQVSDGAIGETEIAIPAIGRLEEMGIRHGGFAIGTEEEQVVIQESDGKAEAVVHVFNKAKVDLQKRHGKDIVDPNTGKVKKKVLVANTAEEIVGQFEEFLKGVIEDEVEKPMISTIHGQP